MISEGKSLSVQSEKYIENQWEGRLYKFVEGSEANIIWDDVKFWLIGTYSVNYVCQKTASTVKFYEVEIYIFENFVKISDEQPVKDHRTRDKISRHYAW